MAISVKASSPEVLKAHTESFSLTVYEAGVPATVTAASYTLMDSGGNVKNSGSLTPVAGVLTITILSTYFTEVEENCFIEWVFTVSGVVNTVRSVFDVVSTRIFNTVIDADLKEFYPDIADHLWATKTNYADSIKLAFAETKGDLTNKGLTPYGIIDASQIKRLVVQKAFYLIFSDFAREPGDIWMIRAAESDKLYHGLLDNTTIRYDASGDGIIDTDKGGIGGIPLWR